MNVGYIILIALFAGAVIYVVVRLLNKTASEPDTPQNGWALQTRSPKGATMKFHRVPLMSDLPVIGSVVDMGVSNGIKAMPEHWREYREHTDVTVLFVAPDATNADGSPALVLTDEQGERHQTAGTVTGVMGMTRYGTQPAIVLPYQDGWHYLTYLMYSTWNEFEHLAESQEPAEFWKYVGGGDVHPHRPLPPEQIESPVGMRGLMATGRDEHRVECAGVIR